KSQVRAPVIVLVLPLAELLGELSRASKDGAAIELILVGSVTALDLPVTFGATAGDVAVREAEVAEVPSEVGAELGAMVGLDPLNGRRESAAQFVDEVGRRANRVVRIDPEDTVPRRFVNGRELVEAPAAQLEVLDVDLDRLAGYVQLPAP